MLSRDIVLKVEGLDIAGRLYLPGRQGVYSAVCVCHGIPARPPDPSDRGYAQLGEQLCREGFAVLTFNFRGTGASGGNLDMLGWARDLSAVIGYLTTLHEVERSRLYLLGFSGGAAVSLLTAARDDRVSAVVSCACPAEFTLLTKNGAEQLIDRFRGIGVIRDSNFPPSAREWLNGFSAIRPVDCVTGISPRPLLLVHGAADETVAVGDAYRLYERAREPKELAIIGGAGHRLRQNAGAMALVLDWLKRLAKLTSRG